MYNRNNANKRLYLKKFFLLVLSITNSSIFSMEKVVKREDKPSESLSLDQLPKEIEYVILEDVLKTKLYRCQFYKDYKKLKIFINSINQSSKTVFQRILDNNFLRLKECQNINLKHDFKWYVYFVFDHLNLDNDIKNMLIKSDLMFSYNELTPYIINLIYYILFTRKSSESNPANEQNNLFIKKILQIPAGKHIQQNSMLDFPGNPIPTWKLLTLYNDLAKKNKELIIATFNNDIVNVKRLLQAGANPNIFTYYGATGFEYMVFHELIYFESNVPLLIVAINKQQLEIVKALINAGAHVNFYYSLGEKSYKTPLYLASQCGGIDIVKELIKAGADVNAKSKSSRYTSLTAASIKGYDEIVNELLQVGADPYYKDSADLEPFCTDDANEQIRCSLDKKNLAKCSDLCSIQ